MHQGLWLGLLDVDDYRHSGSIYYREAGTFAEREHNLSGLKPWERRIHEDHFQSAGSILVPAAGGGREMLALLDEGHGVDGFDCTPELVEVGLELLRERGAEARLLLTEPDEVPDELAGPYDGLWVGWGGYMHIAGRERRVQFLRQLRDRVEEGAPIVLSFWMSPHSSRRLRLIRGLANLVLALRLERRRVEPGDCLPGSFDHHFEQAEVEAEMREGGFEPFGVDEMPYGRAVGHAAALEPPLGAD